MQKTLNFEKLEPARACVFIGRQEFFYNKDIQQNISFAVHHLIAQGFTRFFLCGDSYFTTICTIVLNTEFVGRYNIEIINVNIFDKQNSDLVPDCELPENEFFERTTEVIDYCECMITYFDREYTDYNYRMYYYAKFKGLREIDLRDFN